MKNNEVLAYIKVTRVFTLSETTMRIVAFLREIRVLKLKNSYYLTQKTFEKIYKYQTKEISLNKTSLRASFYFKSERSYLLKSPCKSDQINDGATVITSKVIARGYKAMRVTRLNGCFLVISSFCCRATG